MGEIETKRIAFIRADAEANHFILVSLRCKPQSKTFNRWFDAKYKELCAERERTRAEWNEVKPPPCGRKDRLIKSAQGHGDLASTQAARRLCDKNQWEWRNQ
jgi:hypothetical protein